jgi:hypothetical protein
MEGKAVFPGPDGPVTIHVRSRGRAPWIYPVTVVQARYGGTYSGGGTWLAFPVHPEELGKGAWEDWAGSDIECADWWARQREEGWLVGRGATPDEAWTDLLKIAAEKASQPAEG